MKINGKFVETLTGLISLEELLRRAGFDVARVAVMVGGEIVPRDKLAETLAGDDDELEVVSFVGGG
ncbi:sulfur carrier protein ThiS [Deltaproteobacteria bacterium OttesenSCG-928-K17]|nr:sulfur carrier protein ThiS [Deltaproteobacteria bacterium OttesenSCG-928-K17]